MALFKWNKRLHIYAIYVTIKQINAHINRKRWPTSTHWHVLMNDERVLNQTLGFETYGGCDGENERGARLKMSGWVNWGWL